MTMTGEQQAVAWAENARQALRGLPIATESGCLSVTASFGVAQHSRFAATSGQMLEHADQALLVAKRSGRNRVVAHGSLDEDTSPNGTFADQIHALGSVLAKDVMSSPVKCATSLTNLREVTELLVELRTNSVPVVDDNGVVIGVISEKDVMAASSDGNLEGRIVANHMSHNAVQYNEYDSAQAVYDFFCRNSIRRVVVVNDRRPIGVISRGDLLRWMHGQSISHELRLASIPDAVGPV